ncbi:uncharacterized protein LOC100182506 [Ciona intestinalis]
MDNDTLTVKFYNQCDADFWNAIPGDQEYKLLSDICTTLSRSLNEKTRNLISRLLSGDISCLRPLSSDQKISERSFILLTARFGSTQPRNDSCYLVQQVQNLSKSIVNYDGEIHSWFGGEMTMDEAETRLQNKPDGTYLVRFSEGYAAQGGFAFSVKGVVKEMPVAEGSPLQNIYHYRILNEKPLNNILLKLSKDFGMDQKGREAKTISRLLAPERKNSNLDPEDLVSKESFLSLTTRFGSTKSLNGSCYLLQQIEQLVENSIRRIEGKKYSWFAGDMEMEEAERRLGSSVHGPGTYLIRFSEKEASKGGFVFSIKVNKTIIRHYVIKGKPDTACNGNEYDAKLVLLPVEEGKENETFPNLVTLVEDRIRIHEFHGVKAQYVCRDLQFNAVFRGYKQKK